jgi:integrase
MVGQTVGHINLLEGLTMAGKLNSRKVESLTKPGRYSDGGNLYLFITPNGGKRWTFFYRLGKDDTGRAIRREMGLGSAAKTGVSLLEAREKAADARKLLNAGKDPIEARRASEKTGRAVPTFGSFADEYLETHRSKFRNSKHIAQWEMTLKIYCQPIRSMPINAIETEAVLKVLKPIWSEIPETASRLRGRIENILAAAKAKGHRSGENPATWRGHLKTLLPARQRLTRGHHAALPYDDLPAFLTELRAREAISALALELCILTASRTSEVANALCKEFDLKKAVWTIPATRMKAGHEHRIPLTKRALEILDPLLMASKNRHVFAGNGPNRPLSNMAMSMLLKRMNRPDITVHGFRSTFRDWASEQTSFPHETCEHALAHRISDKAEAAYRRGDQFEKRRKLMEAWTSFCEPRKSAKVLPLKRKS